MVILSEVENLADDLLGCRVRTSMGPPRPIAEASVAVLGKPAFPFVERLPGNPEVPAGSRNLARFLAGMLQNLQSPGYEPFLLCLRHGPPL